MRHFIVGVVGVVAIVIAACSSDSETTGTKGTTAKGGDPSDASTADVKEASTPAPAPTNPPPPKTTCSAQNGADACFQCCEAKSPGGAAVFDQAYRACVCEPTACAAQCAQSECADEPVDPAAGDLCSNCLEEQTECEQAADDACSKNVTCAALAQCIEASGCEGAAKPDGGT